MEYKNVLLTIFFVVVITALIVSIKQDLDIRNEWKEQLEKGELYGACGLCCKFAEGTIITPNKFINITINFSELNLSGIVE